MYIAGLNLPFSSAQGLEVLIVLTNVDQLKHALTQLKATAAYSEAKGGRVRPETMSTFLSRIISPMNGLTVFIPPAIYTGAMLLNGFEQPEWMTQHALPDTLMGVSLGSTWKSMLRVTVCVAVLALRKVTDSVFHHLGEQWHAIGRREKPRVVQTGPYAYVRHPLYTTVLVQQALWPIMFWSYAPLIPLGIAAATFAIKIPIEEATIQRDDGIREEYREYMKRVPARIIPYIW